jgi:hypothetical protein
MQTGWILTMKKLIFILLIVCASGNIVAASHKCPALYQFKEGRLWGLLDCHGKPLFAPQFLTEPRIYDEYAIVDISEADSGIVDRAGRLTRFPNIDLMSEFSEGLSLGRKDSELGFYDRKGQELLKLGHLRINFEGPLAFSFTNGVAGLNEMNGGLYIIRKNGEVTFFDGSVRIIPISNRTFVVRLKNDAPVVVSGNERQIRRLPADLSDYSEGLFRVDIGEDRSRYLTPDGKIVFETRKDYSGNFSEGLAMVSEKDKWGFIDTTGRVRIPMKYDEVRDFSEGLGAVNIGIKWGFVDRYGRLVIPISFDMVEAAFKDGYAYVQKDGYEGYINRRGRWFWKKKK